MSAGKPDILDSVSRPGPTPEPGITALAVIYRRAIDRYEEAKVGSPEPPTMTTQMNAEGDSRAKRTGK